MNSIQKKSVVLGALALMATSLFADPAKKVDLTLSGDTLTVTAWHKVKNVQKHYIDEISITIGDSLVLTEKYTEQTDKEKMVKSFVLPHDLLSSGTIYAETVCNKYGSKTGMLKLKQFYMNCFLVVYANIFILLNEDISIKKSKKET